MEMGDLRESQISIRKIGGEMKINRALRTRAGVLLILILASGAQATTAIPDKSHLMRRAEPGMYPVGLVECGYFGPRTADVEFAAPSDAPDPSISMGKQIFGGFFSGSGMFKARADRSIFPAGVTEAGGGGSVFSISRLLDLSQFKLKVSDEPIPTVALLILVGLVAIIALKGRRK